MDKSLYYILFLIIINMLKIKILQLKSLIYLLLLHYRAFVFNMTQTRGQYDEIE